MTIVCRILLLLTLSCAAIAQDKSGDAQRDVLSRFLERFDQINAMGWVTTRRAGDTGVGYTLESLLEIPENNSPRGDYHGMEVKAFRETDDEPDNDKMNLFLKEPEWIDGLTGAERVRQYGYQDENGRQAWYLSVTSAVSDAGLQLRVNPARDGLEFHRHGQLIGSWTQSVLQQRLTEKHAHSVFVGAAVRNDGDAEQFRYQSVLWCRSPDAGRLFDLVDTGDFIVELRMHLRDDGSLRNHGTAFRVRKQQLQVLFAEQEQVRPVEPVESKKDGSGR